MERKFTKEQIDILIEGLQGTCMSLDEGIGMYLGEDYCSNDLTVDEFEHLQGEIFLCDICGWWYEICDQSDDGLTCCNCGDYE